jgi:DNA primase
LGPDPDDSKQLIKARLNLVEVVQEHVRLRKQSGRYVGLCPFHQEKTPSFNVNEQRQAWHCFGCGKGGDIFSFVELIEKTDFRGALEILAERAGVELTRGTAAGRERSQLRRRIVELNQLAVQYYEYVLHEHQAGAPGRQLLQEREVGDEVARRFGLGYAPGGESFAAFLRKRGRSLGDAVEAGLVRRDGHDFFAERLLVPIRDESGRPLAFTGRTVRKDEPRKYINSRQNPAYEKGRVLFALDLAREEIARRGRAVLMEGQFDVISAHRHGVQNAVASSGTAVTEQQVRLLKRFTDEVIVVLDTDLSGRTATFKVIELASSVELRSLVATLPEGKDPDEYLRGAGSEAASRWSQVEEAAQPGWEYWIRAEIDGLNPSSTRDFEIAVGKVNGVLAKIPDPALRASYRERSANWLGIEPHLMELKVRPEPRRRDTSVESSDGLAPQSAGKELTSELRYLIQVLAVRPEAVDRLRMRFDPGYLDGEEKDAYLRILQTVDRGGAEALQRELDAFPPEWRAAVSEAWTADPIAVGDAVIDEVADKLIKKSAKRRTRLLIGQMREAEGRGDRVQVAALEAQLGTDLYKRQSE